MPTQRGTKPRILLINPKTLYSPQLPIHATEILGGYPLANATLPTLAALAPSGFEVT